MFPDEVGRGVEAVVSVQMGQDHKYAFVGLGTDDMANAVINMDGMELYGKNLSIKLDPSLPKIRVARRNPPLKNMN